MNKDELNIKIKSILQSAIENFYGENYNEAIRELKSAEVYDKNNPEIIYNLGLCHIKLGLYKTAISYLERILFLPLKFIEIKKVKQLLALAYIKKTSYTEAIKQLDEILNESPAETAILNMKAYCLHKDKNYFESLKLYKKIIDLDKNNYNAYNSIAYILAETDGDLKEALKYGKTAIKSDSSNPAYLDTIGYIYIKMKDYDNAEKFINKARGRVHSSKEIDKHIEQIKILKAK